MKDKEPPKQSIKFIPAKDMNLEDLKGMKPEEFRNFMTKNTKNMKPEAFFKGEIPEQFKKMSQEELKRVAEEFNVKLDRLDENFMDRL